MSRYRIAVIPGDGIGIRFRNTSVLIKGACKLTKGVRFNSDFIVRLIVHLMQFSSHLNRTATFTAYSSWRVPIFDSHF